MLGSASESRRVAASRVVKSSESRSLMRRLSSASVGTGSARSAGTVSRTPQPTSRAITRRRVGSMAFSSMAGRDAGRCSAFAVLVLPLLIPGHLDRFQHFLFGLLRLALEVLQVAPPFVQPGEPHRQRTQAVALLH